MWRVLASRLDGKYSFGFIKDADGKVRRELGAEDGEGVKVVSWTADGRKEVYSGEEAGHRLSEYKLTRTFSRPAQVRAAACPFPRSHRRRDASQAIVLDFQLVHDLVLVHLFRPRRNSGRRWPRCSQA